MKKLALVGIICLASIFYIKTTDATIIDDARFICHTVNPLTDSVAFFWRDQNGNRLETIGQLRSWLKTQNKMLFFAVNGGMFNREFAPQGLYIENSSVVTPIDLGNGNGNFYMKPNGVFYITTGDTAKISTSEDFVAGGVEYATQSGPMLVIDGSIHPAFKKGSKNLNIRNGVGVLPDNRILFAMSKEKINFHDFAMFFKNKGCKNALYLDGFVSGTYLPSGKWIQTEGKLGVIIAVTH
ncbi:MAG TPA: phosphodiester glycosidase family protein [Flavobacterium sp.]|jgi:uncharacterized protein YigE (DUF2233 family)